MTEKRPESTPPQRACRVVKPLGPQGKTGNYTCCRDSAIGNPLVAGSSPARPTDEYHVTGGLCMAGGGESCCAFRWWMVSDKFRRDALELRFHRIEESMA